MYNFDTTCILISPCYNRLPKTNFTNFVFGANLLKIPYNFWCKQTKTQLTTNTHVLHVHDIKYSSDWVNDNDSSFPAYKFCNEIKSALIMSFTKHKT